MSTKICWGMCALAAAATALLDGARGLNAFIAADSFGAVVAAIFLTALWSHLDRRGQVLSHAAYAALAGGAIATIVNISITLVTEANAVMIAQRLALGLTGLLYGALGAGILLVASERASIARPVKSLS